jgi:hypothetical protein
MVGGSVALLPGLTERAERPSLSRVNMAAHCFMKKRSISLLASGPRVSV